MNKDEIIEIAEKSRAARVEWRGRGRAPMGYVKGLALSYARAHEKLLAGHSGMTLVARGDTFDDSHDALSWYRSRFRAMKLSNRVAGPDVLRNSFVLLMGLGMRESSGKYCEGRDRSAGNRGGMTCEAGMFQTSWNISLFSTEIVKLLTEYEDENVEGFISTYREGVSCSAMDLKNYGIGAGLKYQTLAKLKPDFAVEVALIGLRVARRHWGPLNTHAAELRREALDLFNAVRETLAPPKEPEV